MAQHGRGYDLSAERKITRTVREQNRRRQGIKDFLHNLPGEGIGKNKTGTSGKRCNQCSGKESFIVATEADRAMSFLSRWLEATNPSRKAINRFIGAAV
jgi:hypothetical protein